MLMRMLQDGPAKLTCAGASQEVPWLLQKYAAGSTGLRQVAEEGLEMP